MQSENHVHVLSAGDSLVLDCDFHADHYNLFDYPVLWRKSQAGKKTTLQAKINDIAFDNSFWLFFIARQRTIAIPSVWLSVRPSRSGTVSKRLNILYDVSHFLQHNNPIILVFPVPNIFAKFWRGHPPPAGALNTGWVYKFRDFRPIPGYMWETVQDRPIVTTER